MIQLSWSKNWNENNDNLGYDSESNPVPFVMQGFDTIRAFYNRNAILNIHPGAGGTESQDWANMLFRLYSRWSERNGYKIKILDFQDGEEAGS